MPPSRAPASAVTVAAGGAWIAARRPVASAVCSVAQATRASAARSSAVTVVCSSASRWPVADAAASRSSASRSSRRSAASSTSCSRSRSSKVWASAGLATAAIRRRVSSCVGAHGGERVPRHLHVLGGAEVARPVGARDRAGVRMPSSELVGGGRQVGGDGLGGGAQPRQLLLGAVLQVRGHLRYLLERRARRAAMGAGRRARPGKERPAFWYSRSTASSRESWSMAPPAAAAW